MILHTHTHTHTQTGHVHSHTTKSCLQLFTQPTWTRQVVLPCLCQWCEQAIRYELSTSTRQSVRFLVLQLNEKGMSKVLHNLCLTAVTQSKYLSRTVDNQLHDDADIDRRLTVCLPEH